MRVGSILLSGFQVNGLGGRCLYPLSRNQFGDWLSAILELITQAALGIIIGCPFQIAVTVCNLYSRNFLISSELLNYRCEVAYTLLLIFYYLQIPP